MTFFRLFSNFSFFVSIVFAAKLWFLNVSVRMGLCSHFFLTFFCSHFLLSFLISRLLSLFALTFFSNIFLLSLFAVICDLTFALTFFSNIFFSHYLLSLFALTFCSHFLLPLLLSLFALTFCSHVCFHFLVALFALTFCSQFFLFFNNFLETGFEASIIISKLTCAEKTKNATDTSKWFLPKLDGSDAPRSDAKNYLPIPENGISRNF